MNKKKYICPKMSCKNRKQCDHAKLHDPDELIEQGDEDCKEPFRGCPACVIEFLPEKEMMI
jgi:hypothetical protein